MQTTEFQPLAAIIITAYNKDKYLRDAIDSAIGQATQFDYVAILSEDLGGDSSRSICEEYALKERHGRAKVLNISENEHLGLVANGYKCIKYALGLGVKYIAQLDCDDLWADVNFLQTQVSFLENNKEYAAAYTDYFLIKENASLNLSEKVYGISKKEASPKYCDAKITTRGLLTANCPIASGTVCYRADNLRAFFQDYALDQTFVTQDLPLWLFLSLHGKFAKCKAKCLGFRELSESASRSADVSKMERFQRGAADIRARFVDIYYKDPRTKKRLKRKIEALYNRKMLRLTAKLSPKSYPKLACRIIKNSPSIAFSHDFLRSAAVYIKAAFLR